MLILDQVKRGDRQLQFVAMGVLLGMLILLSGLWYVQVVLAKKYEDSLRIQSYRPVRVPAVRGKILDRNGVLLADNQPRFDINLYLEDLRPLFTFEYTNSVLKEWYQTHPSTRPPATNKFYLTQEARYRVVSNIVWQTTAAMGVPGILQSNAFFFHYTNKLALPMTVVTNITPQQVAMFLERSAQLPGVELDVEPNRLYPFKEATVHVLGYIQRVQAGSDEDNPFARYRTLNQSPDYEGKSGLEGIFDEELRGKNGVKAILVNNLGYRQREETWVPAEPGNNLVLTIDAGIQKAADTALHQRGATTRGAVLVMDAQNGDVLAMASAPAFDPHMFLSTVTREEFASLNDSDLGRQLNRATYGMYAPGSIFKIVVGLAALENGLDPNEIFKSDGVAWIRSRKIRDTAGAGDFNFRKALALSSNPYFIHYGTQMGEQKIIEMGHRFHLGEHTGILTNQELRGYFPRLGSTSKKDKSRWLEGDTANLSIGQGEIAVTPIQMAGMVGAVANGGRLYWPRLVSAVTSQEPDAHVIATFPAAQIRDELRVNPKNLQYIRDGMLDDVESGGTGKRALVEGMKICGKTGTAEVERNNVTDHYITWFASFAPYEAPKYVVIVMVESGSSGGGTCAPIAREVYLAIRKYEQSSLAGRASMAGIP
jgi:penicillin-binding protein 2